MGPVVLEQVVIPLTPLITQVGVPVGVAPPEGPVTVAVKTTLPPSVTPELPALATVGVALPTVVSLPESAVAATDA